MKQALLVSSLLITYFLLGCSPTGTTQKKEKPPTHHETLEDFIDLRFGMFICYNIMSYGADWGEPDYDISTFNPQNLDCNQWAEAAKSANMKFGLLTTKHHEGFCLWDSEVTDYDVAATPYKKDIVRQYVDAFRAAELRVGLYYSIWDSTHGIDKGQIGPEELAFIKTQIRELLTNYGEIDYFVLDGWFWRMGHHEVPFVEIRELIRELQPNCLITDHTHLQAPYHVDIPYFEGPFGAFPAADNEMASALGHCSFPGNGWFWGENTPQGLANGESVSSLVAKLETLEARYCNFMLNCMPDRNGVLDDNMTGLLTEIGKAWEPDADRPPLPPGRGRVVRSVPIVGAKASSGEAANLIDAEQYGTVHKDWVSDSAERHEIVLDMGEPVEVDAITIVPRHRTKPAPEAALKEGNVLRVKTFASEDNLTYVEISDDQWAENSKYRVVRFPKLETRYLKLEISEAVGERVVVAEVEVGRSFVE